VPELVDHLHLPIQSGSDRILMMMKRGHTALEYKSKIKRLKEVRPNLSMSSDFIIGFPDETDADFEATMKVINDVEFDHSFSFIYSARPGTPASAFVDSVTDEVKKQRLQTVQTRLLQLERQHSLAMLNSKQRVLVERIGERDEGEMVGRTENNRTVMFVGDKALLGKFVDVNIIEAYSNSLRGELAADSVIS
jgi:tRNA-2-methylthio-N6-dimethylallyladenosine synthase